MTTHHPYLNRDAFAFDSAPGRTDRLLVAIRGENAVLRSDPRDSMNAHAAAKNVAMLEGLLEKSKRDDRARDQLHAEIETRRQAEQRRRAALVDQLRTAYLESHGTTEADFESALPGLLKRRAEDAALSGEIEFNWQLERARASVQYSI